MKKTVKGDFGHLFPSRWHIFSFFSLDLLNLSRASKVSVSLPGRIELFKLMTSETDMCTRIFFIVGCVLVALVLLPLGEVVSHHAASSLSFTSLLFPNPHFLFRSWRGSSVQGPCCAPGSWLQSPPHDKTSASPALNIATPSWMLSALLWPPVLLPSTRASPLRLSALQSGSFMDMRRS